MYYWKLDEETIRCLINKNEIKTMGFDVQQLLNDNDQMHSFLDAIVKNPRIILTGIRRMGYRIMLPDLFRQTSI